MEINYVQAYQALRQQKGPEHRNEMIQEALQFTMTVAVQCGLPEASTDLDPDADPFSDTSDDSFDDMVMCVWDAFGNEHDRLFNHLTGPAREEANVPSHMLGIFQLQLVGLGYLSKTAKIDGVFGPETRAAITRWQADRHQETTGLLGDADQSALDKAMREKNHYKE